MPEDDWVARWRAAQLKKKREQMTHTQPQDHTQRLPQAIGQAFGDAWDFEKDNFNRLINDPAEWGRQAGENFVETYIPGEGASLDEQLEKYQMMVGPGMVAAAGKSGTLAKLLGQHKTNTPGRIMNETAKRGGYTVSPSTGDVPTKGLMMGKYKNTDPRNIVTDQLKKSDLNNMAQTNRKAFESPDNYLGTWRDPEGGQTYLDVSRRFDPDNVRGATKFGERTQQKAGWDIGGQREIPVSSWEDFINSDEFAGRLDEMGEAGNDYLKGHPGDEWWDMHGSSFERVYGKENLPQVAGFTASTAPNAAPRENLQTMSEYMRRYIKGERAVQPDWRVPEGQMTRNPGKQIGMEKSRARNLEMTSKGQLDELRADKVREESLAMMGDPSAVVLDRWWARLAENPSAGVFTDTQEGVIKSGKQYLELKDAVSRAALRHGRSPRDFSADVWTGVREQVKNTDDLYGQKFRGSAISGESKGYADHFNDLIERKAQHLGISVEAMEQKLRAGDATLMAYVLSTPLGLLLYQQVSGEPLQAEGI